MEAGARKDEVHIFDYEGKKLLFQVHTGQTFEASPLVIELLDRVEGRAEQDVVSELASRHGLEQTVGAIEELKGMEVISFGPLSPVEDPPAPSPRGSEAPAPISMCLHVTKACNLKCTYCFAKTESCDDGPSHMGSDTARQAVDWLLTQSAESGRCQVDFFGGEPLLNLDLVRETVGYARSAAARRGAQVSFSMTTNATRLSGDALEFVLAEDINVEISIDGEQDVHDGMRVFHDGSGSHDCVTKNIRRMVRRRPDLANLRATFTAKSLNIDRTAKCLSQFGAGSSCVVPVMLPGSHPAAIQEEHLPVLRHHTRMQGRRELDLFVNGQYTPDACFRSKIDQVLNPQKREFGCGAGKTFFGVSTDGRIYLCSAFTGMPKFEIGDVFTGLDQGKRSRLEVELHVDAREPCRSCWARYLCGGGCTYDAVLVTGSHQKPNPIACKQIRYTYELAMGMSLTIQEENPNALEAFYQAAD